jgi:hypothetical protein
MSDEILLCKDCKFSKMNLIDRVFTLNGKVGVIGVMYKCVKTLKPSHDIIDPIVGPKRVKAELSFCEIEREYGNCGLSARNWQPRKKKDLFKLLTREENV